MIHVLESHGISYEGPYESHLGMLTIRFKAPNGIEILVNTATDSSPVWLQI